MRFLIRVMIVFGLVLVALSTLRGLFSPSTPRKTAPGDRAGPTRSGKLVKDPICGTYVTQDKSISTSRGSEMFHFCSEDCREKFLATGT